MRLPRFRLLTLMIVVALVAVELSFLVALTNVFPFVDRIIRYSFAVVGFLSVHAALFGFYYVERVFARYKRRLRRRPFRDSR